MSNTNPARGMRDFLPADVRKRNYVIGIIKEVYEKYGFEPLETPSVENLETLTNKYGDEGNQLMFKILKRGEKLQQELEEGKITSENQLSDLALRYDLTVPLARVVANYKNDLPKFFKRYQIQPVWRADRPAKGRYREFYQCDVDAIGSKSTVVEAELISAVSEILERLEFEDFYIKINHRELLNGLLNECNIDENRRSDFLILLDKRDKLSNQAFVDEMHSAGFLPRAELFWELLVELDQNSLNVTRSDRSMTIEDLRDINRKRIQKIRNFLGTEAQGNNALNSLEEIFKFIPNVSVELKNLVSIDLARGLSYYTGAIFEISLTKGDFAGSIGGGGRYDGLIGMFGKEQIPAVGFSLGLERIIYVMEERGMFDTLIAEGKIKNETADVMVTIWNEETSAESLKAASELREKGLRVLVYPEADKLGKQFKYADSLGIKKLLIIREEEIAENKVKIKNLESGEETVVSRELAHSHI
ncbi:MAG: histidine--tRNA ligase [Pyrinomonadaceae bacterium]|nr:histidine--tRNA ligase [Pyrinomonadaceae bacterium]